MVIIIDVDAAAARNGAADCDPLPVIDGLLAA